jgi:hypothetical protein
MNDMAVVQSYLMYVVMPLWLFAGLADWLCHRAARIECTTGPGETAIHLLMLAEGGIAVLMGLFLEINALLLAIFMIAFIAHEATSYWDVSYAAARRNVSPIEQRVHDYLGVMPFMALSFVLILHWPQFLALFGLGPEPARFSLELKKAPLPSGYVVGLLSAIVVFEVLPYAEEMWRGLRARARL